MFVLFDKSGKLPCCHAFPIAAVKPCRGSVGDRTNCRMLLEDLHEIIKLSEGQEPLYPNAVQNRYESEHVSNDEALISCLNRPTASSGTGTVDPVDFRMVCKDLGIP